MASISEGDKPITSINVTPLVDIILVVLIIFMATAPLINRRSVRVDVPAAQHQERAETGALEVSYSKARALYLAERPVTRDELSGELKRVSASTPELRILVSADEAIPYGEIIRLLDLIRGTGLRRVSLEVRGAR